MRPRTRYLLAVTLLATLWCGDRSAAVAAQRADVTPSRGLVDRIGDAFRRTVAGRPVVRQRCPFVAAVRLAPVAVRTTVIAPPVVCVARLPIPPPAVG